jgi:hypothetical protein
MKSQWEANRALKVERSRLLLEVDAAAEGDPTRALVLATTPAVPPAAML